jgi:ABC-2 type transport system ATP-binding protein
MSAVEGDLAIRVRGLRMGFGRTTVLDGIDLDVPAGTILGYVGPNGAGKTTTVRALCGLLTGFEGEARVAGVDPRVDPVELKRRIGYVPESPVLFETLTVAELLLFVGRLRGLADATTRARADEFLEVLEIDTRLGSRISTLSKGMRQKLCLTAGLLHDPRVIFLDEPLSGLDVGSSILVKRLMRGLADRGAAVFYCSHVMDVVERVCDRIAILHGGRIAAVGSFDELARASGGGSLEGIFAELTRSGEREEDAERLLRALERDAE